MSYSISLNRDGSESKIKDIKWKDMPIGGTMMIGGGSEDTVPDDCLDLNITWNYAWYFYNTVSKENGIREIYGKKAKDVIPLLESALPKLDKMIEEERRTGMVLSETWGKGSKYDENDKNYWSVSAKNAKKALEGLIFLGKAAPNFTFHGD